MGIGTLTKPIPVSMLSSPIHLLSLGFGSGLSRYAPGTMGTLVAIPLYLLLSRLELLPYLIVVAAGFLLGIYVCDKTSKALGVHDHSGIVWDEIIGYWITMVAIPAVTWQWILAGFVLFRFFDIVKPWPVKIADKRVPGGFGIMFDDLLAGLYALACIQISWLFFIKDL
jgi:phosphatidylglycerophosphatase A